MEQEMQSWKNTGLQLLKTKSEAHTDVVVGMMLFLVLVVALLFGFRISQFMITAAGVEDALAASNLASAVIDLEEYGRSHTIQIPDTEMAFWTFREALCYNLRLDEYLNTTNTDFLAAPIEIKEYIVYNVKENVVETQVRDGKGQLLRLETGVKGMVYTPDKICVETTTIYSRIGYWVEGLMGQVLYGEKEKSVDIVRCDSE